MAKKHIDSCLACSKTGHRAVVGRAPWRPYICPLSKNPYWWGKTGVRQKNGRCSECGFSGFDYSNGSHYSEDGIRGYRCMNPECGTIKPERLDFPGYNRPPYEEVK